jgi:hypothetical protein
MNVTMGDQLSGSFARRCKIEFVHNIIQASFQQLQKRLTCVAFGALGTAKIPHELLFCHAVVPFYLLLLAQPNTVLAQSASMPAVHAGGEISLSSLDLALGSFAFDTLEKQLHPFAPTQSTRWTNITSHFSLISCTTS